MHAKELATENGNIYTEKQELNSLEVLAINVYYTVMKFATLLELLYNSHYYSAFS